MKTIRTNGLKLEIADLDYNFIKEKMESNKRKGKTDRLEAYSKLLNNIDKNSTAKEIENEVNAIIDIDRKRIKDLKNEIKRYEKEISILTYYSERENEADVMTTLIANL